MFLPLGADPRLLPSLDSAWTTILCHCIASARLSYLAPSLITFAVSASMPARSNIALGTKIGNELLNELLATWPVGRLATIGPRGPHVVPIVFCRDGDALYSPVDGKAKASTALKRVANVAHDPHFSLLLDHYDDQWQRLWWVRLDGKADVDHPAEPHLGVLRDLMATKYPQYADVAVTAGRPTFLELRWHSVASWAAAEFSHTLLFS